MSRNADLIYVTPSSACEAALQMYVSEWERGTARWPYRSMWLGDVEELLASYFPDASRASLNLTARTWAPFPLKAGHDVP